MPSPGRLVALEDALEWRSPSGSAPSDATAQYRLENRGGRPVRITSLESGCGCAEPKVEPETIGPGGSALVTVKARPFQVGQRVVEFVLNTDSPITPVVRLALKMIGTRKPPFILYAGGDLSWPAGLSDRAPREVRILTVGGRSDVGAPRFDSDLPFLHFTLTSQKESPYTEVGTYQRDYLYRVDIQGETPEGAFTGEVIVTPSWDDDKARIPIHGEVSRPVRVVPSHPVLGLKDASDSEGEATFCVLMREPDPGLEVRTSDGSEMLAVSRDRDASSEAPSRVARFTVRLKPGRTVSDGGVHRLKIASPAKTSETVTAAITVTVGGAR